jgi:hypothetical protein
VLPAKPVSLNSSASYWATLETLLRIAAALENDLVKVLHTPQKSALDQNHCQAAITLGGAQTQASKGYVV